MELTPRARIAELERRLNARQAHSSCSTMSDAELIDVILSDPIAADIANYLARARATGERPPDLAARLAKWLEEQRR